MSFIRSSYLNLMILFDHGNIANNSILSFIREVMKSVLVIYEEVDFCDASFPY